MLSAGLVDKNIEAVIQMLLFFSQQSTVNKIDIYSANMFNLFIVHVLKYAYDILENARIANCTSRST